MDRYICIHGHFYQPPRENPWLEAIEAQDSAYPYHDWNERVTAECYEPNAASRILDGEGLIVKIVNNYEKISFNFGPTLMAWMKDKTPKVYEAVIAADKASQKRFSGHGSALAQSYNHLIHPLANRRDKETQILWGIVDFESRFGRRPEGMWLPEAAVDLESLDIMAEHGIRFTILSPYQARRTRRRGTRWKNVGGGGIDPSRPYLLQLPSGREIHLFFYDGPISRAVAFEKLLSQGEKFAHRLVGAFSDERTWPQLMHIATDGETYGHHHQFGDMALAYALQYIEKQELATLTNYAEYLEKHPTDHFVEIFESSSWSCAHGIERWRSDCGCHTGGGAGWNQAWRAPLREALDWLRDELAPRFEEKCRQYLSDPWAARNDFIRVVLDRSPENVERYLQRHAVSELLQEDRIGALKLMELQRQAMLMYTSCGWFFSDLSGIETMQVLRYAGRALQLARELFDEDLEGRFLGRLDAAKSNVEEEGDGRQIYERYVRPAIVDLEKVGAHYSISSLFESYPDKVSLACFNVERRDSHLLEAGRSKLLIGRAHVASEITQESSELSYGVLHFGGHQVNAGVRTFLGSEAYRELLAEVAVPFEQADFPAVIRLLDRHFGESTYSLRSLFRDEQRRILNSVLGSALNEAEAVYRQLHEHHAPTMRFFNDLGIPSPKAFLTAAEFALNSNLRNAFENEVLDPKRIESLLREAKTEGVSLDKETLTFAWRKAIEKLADQFFASADDQQLLERLDGAAALIDVLPFKADLWKVQNRYYQVSVNSLPYYRSRVEQGEPDAKKWVDYFTSLGKKLSMKVG